MMPQHTPVLFDLDGTLSDNYPGIARSIAYALERLGVEPVPETDLRTCVGPPLRESFRRLLATEDAATIERAIAFYRERFTDVGWRENTLYDGIEAVLQDFATHSTLYLCTAKPEPFARRIVELFGLTRHFTGLYGADLAGHLDDKATLIAHLAREERIDPALAVMIGDRAHDVRAARANGARAIGVLWGYGSREELADADALVSAPQELSEAVARLR